MTECLVLVIAHFHCPPGERCGEVQVAPCPRLTSKHRCLWAAESVATVWVPAFLGLTSKWQNQSFGQRKSIVSGACFRDGWIMVGSHPAFNLGSGPWAIQASGRTHSGPWEGAGRTSQGCPSPRPWVPAGAAGVSRLQVTFPRGSSSPQPPPQA